MTGAAGTDAFAAGRTRRFLRGAAAALASQVVRAGTQLVLVPVFLAAWGEALYGEWLTLSAMAAQMGLLDLGVQTFVLNRLNQHRARGEHDDYARVLHSALWWCLTLAGAAALLAAGGAALLPIESWFRLSLVDHGLAAATAAVLFVQMAAQVPYGLVTGIYRTVGEYPAGMAVYNADRILHTALTAGVVVLGGGLVHVALVQLVPACLCVAWVLRDLRRRHPDLAVGVSRRERGLALSFLGPSSLFFLIRASQAAAIQGVALVAGALLGPAAVAVFVTLRTLCNLVRQLANSLSNALWPELTALEARGDLATLRRVHGLAVKAVTAASLAAALALHWCGGVVVELWTGGELSYSQPLMDALLLLLVVQAPWTTSSIVLVATNRHGPVALAYGLSSALGLALAWVLGREHGLPGLVLGVLAGEVLVAAWLVPAATCRLLRERAGAWAARVLLPALPVAGAAFGAGFAAAQVAGRGAAGGGWLAGAATAVLAVPVLTWSVWLDDWERGRAGGLLRKLARR